MEKVKRARISNYDTGAYIELSLNPTSVSQKNGNKNIATDIPGQSDPWMGWGAGKGERLSFSILVHAQAHYDKFGIQIINEAENDFIDAANGWSIAGQLEFYKSFCFPSDPDKFNGTGGAPLLVFSMGRYFRAALYRLDDLDINVTEWNADHDPTAADVSFSMTRVESENRFSDGIYDYSGAGTL